MANATFQVSSKLHDGRIFVIAGETYEEFKSHVSEVLGPDGCESMLTTMATSIEGAPVTIAQAVGNLAALGVTPVAPNAATYTPSTASTGRSCQHGVMTKRSGASAKGPWKAYMCSTPKGTPDQCEPVFIRRNEPEWNSF